LTSLASKYIPFGSPIVEIITAVLEWEKLFTNWANKNNVTKSLSNSNKVRNVESWKVQWLTNYGAFSMTRSYCNTIMSSPAHSFMDVDNEYY